MATDGRDFSGKIEVHSREPEAFKSPGFDSHFLLYPFHFIIQNYPNIRRYEINIIVKEIRQNGANVD
jgi:hypothetical protein